MSMPTTIGPGSREYLAKRYGDSPEAMAWLAAQPGPPAKPPRKPRPDEVGQGEPATRAEAEAIGKRQGRRTSNGEPVLNGAQVEPGRKTRDVAGTAAARRLAMGMVALEWRRKGWSPPAIAVMLDRSPGTVRRGLALAEAHLEGRGIVLKREDSVPLPVEELLAAIPGPKRKARRKARPRGRPVGSKQGSGRRCFDLKARRAWLDAQQTGGAATSPQVAPAATA